MSWYDLFSNVYDAALELQYAEQRRLAAAALQLELTPRAFVLDVPCGTGQSFGLLAASVGREGRVLGVDLSEGMLRRARQRCEREQLSQVSVLQSDAAQLDRAAIGGDGAPTHLHIFLGMSVFPDPERTFATLWGLLAPGGRCAIVDVYAERPGLQGRMVNHLANADISRRFWEALARVGAEFSLTDLPFRWQHGGQIKLATARKARP